MVEYKIAIVGRSNVGKSSLVMRYTHKVFMEKHLHTTIDIHKKFVTKDGISTKLCIYDTEGFTHENFQWGLDAIRESDGVLIIYALDDPLSFADSVKIIDIIWNVKHWKTIKNRLIDSQDYEKPPCLLIGNKSDLQKIHEFAVDSIRQKFNVEFLKTSAKNGTNVNEIFQTLIDLIPKKIPPKYTKSNSFFQSFISNSFSKYDKEEIQKLKHSYTLKEKSESQENDKYFINPKEEKTISKQKSLTTMVVAKKKKINRKKSKDCLIQ